MAVIRRRILILIIFFLSLSYIFITLDKVTKKTRPKNAVLDPDCLCRQVSTKNTTMVHQRSVCSQHATDRGQQQKVISYSFYGPLTSAYFNGIFENLMGVTEFYPGYVMRLYYDRASALKEPESFRKICDLFCAVDNFDLCDVNEIDEYPDLPKKFGMLWRFAPMSDSLVSEWHCRDLDSRISQRELAAVTDWNNSGRTYHIMRDNKFHVASIVGCCFGMKNDNASIMKQHFEAMLDYAGQAWFKGLDQSALHKIVWPRAQTDMVAHDSYLCKHYPSPFNRAWPTQRISGPSLSEPAQELNFVGSNGGKISMQNHGPCPAQCRPANHQDWILC